ncbi:hypothetical protein PAHAL_6G070100 [Panicum hallii]|uniref:Ubiquitin-like domain-containing protein n=1 Tax=Panicum hallii TaxID=206008 RepID=A0A2S3I1R5_9POAL|nr:uncharacterized protein LOC112897700 isoform X4 [Panicum hallii]PAN34125.1 hypothetical protein PAHAL_6G070100 [Panicum hallii]
MGLPLVHPHLLSHRNTTTLSPRKLICFHCFELGLDCWMGNFKAYIKIFVRSCHGTCLLNTNLQSGTVETLKCLVEEREGIPAKDQYLIFGAKPLRDGTLLRDYAIRDESTIDVLPRIRGGSREDMTLDELLVRQAPLTKDAVVNELPPGPGVSNSTKVLDEAGVRVLRGIMSCVLKNHKAKLAFRENELTAEKLRVSVVTNEQDGVLWETASVKLHNISAKETLTDDTQKENLRRLREVIERVFRRTGGNGPQYPLHVESIDSTLVTLSAETTTPLSPATSGLLAGRTQLLEALAATVDPVQMASMWWNLIRFQDSLTRERRTVFRKAVESTKQTNWSQNLSHHPLFSNVYNYENPPSYDNSAVDLLFFARNWFTHVPKQQWNDLGAQVFQGLPHLDYIFTHHFIRFLPNLLLGLREKKFDLREILVPLT